MAERPFIYLDHSATTPLDPRVLDAMLPYFTGDYGNAASAHRAGRAAERAANDARETIARILHCAPGELVFTGGGTESDNLALRGAAWAGANAGKRHLLTTPVEHSAIGKTVDQLAALADFTVSRVAVDPAGWIDPEDFAAALRPDTAIASVIYANNEVGTIAPLPRLAEHARERGVWLHTDAVQAAGQLTLNVQTLGVDMMSLSAHKFYGPKGVGLLFVHSGVEFPSAQTGGSHEEGRRAGTLNTPGIVGMAKALQLAYEEQEERVAHLTTRRDQLIDGVLSRVPGAMLTGHPTQRLPSHASFVIDGVDGNTLLMHLDMKGVAASSASACKTGNPEPSDVLLAMGYPPYMALGSVRTTVGLKTSEAEIESAIEILTATVARLRKLRQSSMQYE